MNNLQRLLFGMGGSNHSDPTMHTPATTARGRKDYLQQQEEEERMRKKRSSVDERRSKFSNQSEEVDANFYSTALRLLTRAGTLSG